MKQVCNVRSVSFGVKWELYGRLVVSKVLNRKETKGIRKVERHKLGVVEMKRLRRT